MGLINMMTRKKSREEKVIMNTVLKMEIDGKRKQIKDLEAKYKSVLFSKNIRHDINNEIKKVTRELNLLLEQTRLQSVHECYLQNLNDVANG